MDQEVFRRWHKQFRSSKNKIFRYNISEPEHACLLYALYQSNVILSEKIYKDLSNRLNFAKSALIPAKQFLLYNKPRDAS